LAQAVALGSPLSLDTTSNRVVAMVSVYCVKNIAAVLSLLCMAVDAYDVEDRHLESVDGGYDGGNDDGYESNNSSVNHATEIASSSSVQPSFAAPPISSSLRGAKLAGAARVRLPAVSAPRDNLFFGDGDTLKFVNYRDGSPKCLDHGPDQGNVGAYPCDDHGGNQWIVECPGSMQNPQTRVCDTMRLVNYRYGDRRCLDHGPEQYQVGAYPCDDHGGDEWSFEFTGPAVYDGGVLRLKNYRFGQEVCLDHTSDGGVAAYPCDNNGGDDWHYDSYY